MLNIINLKKLYIIDDLKAMNWMKELINSEVNENIYNFDIWIYHLYHSSFRSKICWFWENRFLLFFIYFISWFSHNLVFSLICFYILLLIMFHSKYIEIYREFSWPRGCEFSKALNIINLKKLYIIDNLRAMNWIYRKIHLNLMKY